MFNWGVPWVSMVVDIWIKASMGFQSEEPSIGPYPLLASSAHQRTSAEPWETMERLKHGWTWIKKSGGCEKLNNVIEIVNVNMYKYNDSGAAATGSCAKADRVSKGVQDQIAFRGWQLAMGVWRDVSSSSSDDDSYIGTEDTVGRSTRTHTHTHVPILIVLLGFDLFFWDLIWSFGIWSP